MPVSAEVALVRVTVHAMEQLASALKAKPVPLEPQERAAFAGGDEAMHGRRDALQIDEMPVVRGYVEMWWRWC
jgi:hypothetical protein